MKKLITALIVLSAALTFAQEMTFGAMAGYNSVSQKVSYSSSIGDGSDSGSAGGFLVGGFMNYEMSDKFSIRPHLLYTSFKPEGADKATGFLMTPILGKYNITDSFSVLAGPQLNFKMSEKGDDEKSMSFGLNLGTMYNITDNIFIQANYELGLSNLSEVSGVTDKLNFLNISVGYNFNLKNIFFFSFICLNCLFPYSVKILKNGVLEIDKIKNVFLTNLIKPTYYVKLMENVNIKTLNQFKKNR